MIPPSQTSHFTQQSVSEQFFCAETPPKGDFRRNALDLLQRYQQICYDHQCGESTEVALKFHLSDIANQAKWLESQFAEARRKKIIFVGQAPASGAHLGLEAYHLQNQSTANFGYPMEFRDADGIIHLHHYRLVQQQSPRIALADPEAEMQQAFQECERQLNIYGGNVKDNTLRTWIYVRDIDNNYASIVKARNQIFEQWGMDKTTHTIASTGIEGQSISPQRKVSMVARSILGLVPEQIEYMSALDHMPPTRTYGVAFERGTRVIYGDRSHYYISGTASIDAQGQVMHLGDIRAQTQRSVENVRALLENHQGTLADLKVLTIYLRDPADCALAQAELDKCLPPSVPRLIVRGSVCRPEWLIELEGIAINSKGNRRFPDFA